MNGCCIGNFDLCIQQGATYEQVFTWMQTQCTSAVGAAPAPIDLTGYTAAMQIRAYPGSPTLLYDASGDIVLGGTAGTIALTIDAVDTDNFTFFSAVYDLFLTSPAGIVTKLLSGDVDVCPAVTTPSSAQFILTPGGQVILSPSGGGIVSP